MTYSHESRSQTVQNTGKTEDNKQPIGKQHADNQSEVDTSYRARKGENEKVTGRERIVNYFFFNI